MINKILPNLCDHGHTLVITGHYPPSSGGSSIIMRNLLAAFNPKSYSVVTAKKLLGTNVNGNCGENIYYVLSRTSTREKLDWAWLNIQLPIASIKTINLAKKLRPSVIVGVYPDLCFLLLALRTSRATGIPWIAYLHDTLVEALSNKMDAKRAIRLQSDVFNEASSLFVMSEGMAELYNRKYSVVCKVLEHTYPEAIVKSENSDIQRRQAFWGGEVYSINDKSLSRVSISLDNLNCPFYFASSLNKAGLHNYGIVGKNLKTGFFSNRKTYLEELKRQGLLVLALNWPDESKVHIDELSTIFPTKTPEYLASGRPILVHCPENYFLAKFFKRHKCGMVVSERSVEALKSACKVLLSNNGMTNVYITNAFSIAKLFSTERIADLFSREINMVYDTN